MEKQNNQELAVAANSLKKHKKHNAFIRNPFAIVVFVILIIYVISFLFPFLWVFVSSFKDGVFEFGMDTTIVAAITSRHNKAKLPTHIEIGEEVFEKDSVVLLEQIRTVDKSRLKEYVGKLDNRIMDRINKAISISVGLKDNAGENKDDGRTG